MPPTAIFAHFMIRINEQVFFSKIQPKVAACTPTSSSTPPRNKRRVIGTGGQISLDGSAILDGHHYVVEVYIGLGGFRRAGPSYATS
jgi:hypothetical protein